MKPIDHILIQLADLIQQGRFAELETEWLEIKPVPADGGEWKERHKSVNAFLNTRGGIMILGVKEEGTGPARRYVVAGWKDHAEPNLKEFPRLFTDRKGVKQDLGDMPLTAHFHARGAVCARHRESAGGVRVLSTSSLSTSELKTRPRPFAFDLGHHQPCREP